MKTLIAMVLAAFAVGASAQGHEHGHPGGPEHGQMQHHEGPDHHWDNGQIDRAHNWQQDPHRWHDGRWHEGPPHFEPRHRGHWEWRGNRRVWIIVDETCIRPDWNLDVPICLEWAPF